MDYMYGQLYKQIKEIGYKGRNSETTIVTVDTTIVKHNGFIRSKKIKSYGEN